MSIRATAKRIVRSLLTSIKRKRITFGGGSGDSVDEAVIIRGTGHDLTGTWAEFYWLTEKFGQNRVDWQLVTHGHSTVGEREIDTVVIRLASGTERTFYFDITESFGKWPEL